MPIVSETKKLEEKEFTTLKELQQKFQNLQFELGEIEIIKLQIEERYQTAKTFLSTLQQEEKNFTKSLTEKYGNISIDPENGEYSSVE